MTSRFTPTWDILNPRSAAAQGFLTPYLHSDPDLVYRFQHFVPKWIESHQRRLAGTPAFRRRLIELTHPQQYVPHCKTDRAPSLGLGREHRVAGRGADKEFVCNLATFDLRNAVLETSGPFPRGVNEMDRFELAPAPSRLVRPPRAAASPCALECRLLQIIDLKGPARTIIRPLRRIRTSGGRPIARCGYADYSVADKVFAMARPQGPLPKGGRGQMTPAAGASS